MSSGKIAYYIHHYGNGHLQQALHLMPSIIHLKPILICAMQSFAARLREAFPSLRIYVLPDKYAKQERKSISRTFDNAFEGTPYAFSATQRSACFISILEKEHITLFLSDVSAELTILARGAGVRTLMLHLHGNTTKDPTQVFAYECAAALYAPFPQELEAIDYRYKSKTSYLGWLASPKQAKSIDIDKNTLTIIHSHKAWVGELLDVLANHIAHIQVIGVEINGYDNVTSTLYVNNLMEEVASEVVIIAGGNNLVGEMMQAQKKIIIVPEQRPYEEQYHKAMAMERAGWAICLDFNSFRPSAKEIIAAYERAQKQVRPNTVPHHAVDQFTHLIQAHHDRF